MATLLHGLLVLGAVWFWTLRPPELRPVFQGGDVSLAVTFVAAAEAHGASSVERGATEDNSSRKPETADILTDPETEIPEEASAVVHPKPVVRTDSAAEPLPEEGEDQDMLDAEAAGQVSAQASANVPENGRQTPLRETATAGQATDSAAEPLSDALSQGVSGAVRRKSEIRPYYPLGARLRGEEGTVTVRVWVTPSGRARRCEVARSSGYPVLDEAAVDAARRARYVSTRPGAWRAEAETTLTFRFRLTE